MTNTESQRRIHFVGTMPQFTSAHTAFRWEQAHRTLLRRWYGGETGDRLQWFVPVVKRLIESTKVRLHRAGSWSNYDDTDRLSIRAGRRLTPGDIPLQLVEHFRQELCELPGDPAMPLQVGVPGYLDMALFMFGPVGLLAHARTFRRSLSQHIAAIHDLTPGKAVFQLEVPLALIVVATVPRPVRNLAAAIMARFVLAQVRAAPAGTAFGVHLCLGDLGHRALRQLEDAHPLTSLTNALVKRWPTGTTLAFVHLPFSGGEQPPSADASFYAPLRHLDAGDATVVAGLAHEEQDERTQRLVLHHVEAALRRRVDIATSCGLGRRSVTQAEAAVSRMIALTRDVASRSDDATPLP